jgi:FkbM family methyltransferase
MWTSAPNNYKETSTTFYLEEHLHWSGIAIDAEDIHRPGWEKHRPRSKYFTYAVTDKSNETIKFFRAYGLSATELDTDSLHVWEETLKMKAVEVEVPTITLDDLLEQEGVEKIDFLSIDINGAEVIALAGFDIERYRPELVHVEAAEHRYDALLAYFDQHSYQRIDDYLEYDSVKWYFTPKTK